MVGPTEKGGAAPSRWYRRRLTSRTATQPSVDLRPYSHEGLERRGYIFHLRLAEHPLDHVVLDGHRFEIGEALGLLVVPAHHGLGLLVRLRDLLHHRLDLFRLRLQALRAHELR